MSKFLVCLDINGDEYISRLPVECDTLEQDGTTLVVNGARLDFDDLVAVVGITKLDDGGTECE